MKNRDLNPPTQEHRRFHGLLEFLVCNRSLEGLHDWEVEALQGKVYEDIRGKLIRLFRWRGSTTPEDLVDRTFERVSKRLPDPSSYVGDPSHYVCAVGRLIFLESLREKPPQSAKELVPNEPNVQALDCLDDCISQLLTPLERELILEYYRDDKRPKIERRGQIARQLGTSVNSLRIRTCRIRTRLRKCVLKCMKVK